MKDPYKVLGMSKNSDPEALRERYAELKARYGEQRFRDGEEGNEGARKLNELEESWKIISGDIEASKVRGGGYGEIEERGDASQRHEHVQRKLHQAMVFGDFEKRAGGGERRRPHNGEDVSVVHSGAAVRAVLEELGRMRDELLLLGDVRLPNDVHPLLVSQLVVCGLCVRRETLRYDGARENLLARDGLVDVDQELVGQVLAVIHFSVVFVQLDEVFQLHAALWLHVRVVRGI